MRCFSKRYSTEAEFLRDERMRRLGLNPTKRVACVPVFWCAGAVLAGLFLAVLAGLARADGPSGAAGVSHVADTNRYAFFRLGAGQNPVKFRRQHREVIRTPGGCVGIRAEVTLTNLPGVMCLSVECAVDGGQWVSHPVTLAADGRSGRAEWDVPRKPTVELYRLRVN